MIYIYQGSYLVTINCLAKCEYNSTLKDWYKRLAFVTFTMSENLREPLLDSKATYMLQVKFDVELILIKPNLILSSHRRQRKWRINLG